jgi:signal transduction histidine kinase
MRFRVSIRRKILLTFVLFFVLSIFVTLFGYYRYHVLNLKIHLVEKKDLLLNSILEARRYEKNFFITLNMGHLEDALSYVQASKQNFEQLIRQYRGSTYSKNLDSQLENLEQYRNSLEGLLTKIQDLPEPIDANIIKLTNFSGQQEKIRFLGREITIALEKGLQKERDFVKRLTHESRWYLFIFLGVTVFIASATWFFLILNVNYPLKKIEKAILKIAQGDYESIPVIRTGDEFERLVESLNKMLRELHRRSEQLIQNKKMAALGTLTSGVAHELNNPLNNISTSLQIILEEIDDGDLEFQRELLTESESEVNRAQDIVKSLLEYSREREFSLSREHFRTLVASTLKLIQGEIPSSVRLVVDVPDDIYASMDPRRIQQVLLNLIINAVQAMEDKGGILTLRAYEQENRTGFIFQVIDTGKGIPAEELSKIFDPFYTTKDIGKGSGLGLSVSQGIITNHGGSIWVESEPDQGTTFTMYIPYAKEEGCPSVQQGGLPAS